MQIAIRNSFGNLIRQHLVMGYALVGHSYDRCLEFTMHFSIKMMLKLVAYFREAHQSPLCPQCS